MPAFFSSLLCSIFAISCLSLSPNVSPPSIIVEELPSSTEIVIDRPTENNDNYFSSAEEGIISEMDWEGIVDFEESAIITTSTESTSTEIIISINPIESFAAAPAVYAPKDFAPVDPIGEQYAVWLEAAWINTVTSTNALNASTTTIENVEEIIIDDEIVENIQDTATSTEPIVSITVVTTTLSTTGHIVINAISIGTASSTLDEFIDIYNPTADVISLDGWKLQRVTASGKTANYLVRPFSSDSSINSNQYIRIAHPSGYVATTPDVIMAYTTASSIASSNTIILFNSQGEVVDLVGYGEATQFEGSSALELSNDGQVLSRTDGADSDNNSVDFKLRSR